jgi:hypothetical protein
VRTVAVIVPRVLAIAAVTARSGIARSTLYRHTSSTSRDQAIFVDQATDASLLAEVGELRGEAPRERGAVHRNHLLVRSRVSSRAGDQSGTARRRASCPAISCENPILSAICPAGGALSVRLP